MRPEPSISIDVDITRIRLEAIRRLACIVVEHSAPPGQLAIDLARIGGEIQDHLRDIPAPNGCPLFCRDRWYAIDSTCAAHLIGGVNGGHDPNGCALYATSILQDVRAALSELPLL